MVRDEVRRLMDEVGRDGGFIISPSHDMPGYPIENMVALIETVRRGDFSKRLTAQRVLC